MGFPKTVHQNTISVLNFFVMSWCAIVDGKTIYFSFLNCNKTSFFTFYAQSPITAHHNLNPVLIIRSKFCPVYCTQTRRPSVARVRRTLTRVSSNHLLNWHKYMHLRQYRIVKPSVINGDYGNWTTQKGARLSFAEYIFQMPSTVPQLTNIKYVSLDAAS